MLERRPPAKARQTEIRFDEDVLDQGITFGDIAREPPHLRADQILITLNDLAKSLAVPTLRSREFSQFVRPLGGQSRFDGLVGVAGNDR